MDIYSIPYMKLKSSRIYLFIALIYCSYVNAQSVNPELASILDFTLDSMHTEVPAKSLSAAIVFSDGSVWKNVEGISSETPLVNVTTEDTYLIGSIVKTITSGCILQLHDEGVLSIEDSIHEWLPPIEYVNPNITIRQLLQHKSGLYDVLSNPALQPVMLGNVSQIWTAEQVLNQYLLAPINNPGGSWSYCNTNYFLLGMIIEAATGNPFYVEFRNRFFTPLGLSTFGIPAFEEFDQPVAHVWMDLFGSGQTQDAHFFYSQYLSLNSIAGAAGGYYATPEDVSKWMWQYMRGNLLQPATLDDAKNTVIALGLPNIGYGLGLNKKTFAGHVGYGHGGDLAYSASSWYFPDFDLSITVCGNDADVISWELIPVVEELLEHIEDSNLLLVDQLNAQSSRYLNVYPNPTTGVVKLDFSDFFPVQWMDIEIFNAIGEIIKSHRYLPHDYENHLIELHLDDIPIGLYHIRSSDEKGNATTIKLMKS